MKTVQQLRQKWFSFPAIMLGAVLLRAFVPAGYMPAAPGQGLLFELCDAGVPTSFAAALDEHAHHGGHDAHEDHGAFGDCSFGHIVAGAAIALVNDLPAMLLAVSRLMFAWAEDGVFPRGVARIHRAWHTPHVALVLSGLMATAAILGSHFAGDFFLGVDILVTSMLVNFGVMCLTVIRLPTAARGGTRIERDADSSASACPAKATRRTRRRATIVSDRTTNGRRSSEVLRAIQRGGPTVIRRTPAIPRVPQRPHPTENRRPVSARAMSTRSS